MDENKQNGNNGNKENNKNQNKVYFMICVVAAVTMLLGYFFFSRQWDDSMSKEVTYDKFLEMLETGKFSEVKVYPDAERVVGIPVEQPYKNGEISYYTGLLEDGNVLQQRCEKAGVTYQRIISDNSAIIWQLLLNIVPFLLITLFMIRMISRNSGVSFGKSKAKVYMERETGVTFQDVAGQEEAKESLTELVDFLHNPGKYTKIGAKLPKGALLVGPPGTGKTLLAKAVAGEAKVPFISLSGSDFVELYVGVGASRVRDLFRQAQQMAPCIIFIDEIDTIGKSRAGARSGGSNDEQEQTLNQLLSEMDGFDTSKGLVVLGATNRPEVLDKALLRPGRFDRRIIVDKPDLKGRIDILKVHAKNVLLDDSVDLEAIALATSGAVGSDLANMINEAAILAVKRGRNYVTQEDLFESVEVVIAGKEKKERILSKEEKKVVAYHEVGHALISALDKNSEPVQKITIVPRMMGTLGYVLQAPEEEKYLMSKEEMLTKIVTFCGGRASEELVFGSITTGASNDIERATSLARAMITKYGMSEKFGLVTLETTEYQYLDGRPVMNCADATAAEIDKEVRNIISECYEKAKAMLSENREALDKIAAYLFEKESITGKEFMKIFREIKGIPEEEAAERADVSENAEESLTQGSEEATQEQEEPNV
ncbi:MAG: ATP-dependent zinc metalloprotease FtsH [Lachnospiraceae bacterium]